MLEKRKVSTVVILTIITFGIYGIWWTHVTMTALRNEGNQESVPVVLVTVFMIFSHGAGGAFLGFDANANMNIIKAKHGLPAADNKILWVVFGAFIPVVTIAMVQNEINGLLG